MRPKKSSSRKEYLVNNETQKDMRKAKNTVPAIAQARSAGGQDRKAQSLRPKVIR